MKPPKDYDATVARIAGNIAAGLVSISDFQFSDGGLDTLSIVATSVTLARRIVERVRMLEAKDRAVGAEERARQDERPEA